MVSAVNKLVKDNLINPPKWLPNNTELEVITGSFAYGVSSDTSDMDVYGFCMPPKHIIFPHLNGHIQGFGKQLEAFNVFSQHHIFSKETRKQYDITIYSIVSFFELCRNSNPNMIDALFSPTNCVLHSTEVGNHLRDNRKLFLCKDAYKKFRGYAYTQLSKLDSKANKSNPKRQESINKYGYDTKFAYHIVRLLLQVEQILTEGDLDLRANISILKSIRRGEWKIEKIKDFFDMKEKTLEECYNNSKLPNKSNDDKIKQILIDCIEMRYGNIADSAIVLDTNYEALGSDIRNVLEKYKI